jgi:hypothetical protein
MWYRKTVIFALLSLTLTANALESDAQSHRRYVIVPSESLLLVIAAQADSPLKFEHAKLLTSTEADGAWGASYKVRNCGMKPIRSFTAVMWTSFGTGGTVASPRQIGNKLIMPGETANGDDDEIVPLTNELRDKLQLRGPMKAVVVLLVESVTFADGSVYNYEAASRALAAYFLDVSDKVYRVSGQKHQP